MVALSAADRGRESARVRFPVYGQAGTSNKSKSSQNAHCFLTECVWCDSDRVRDGADWLCISSGFLTRKTGLNSKLIWSYAQCEGTPEVVSSLCHGKFAIQPKKQSSF